MQRISSLPCRMGATCRGLTLLALLLLLLSPVSGALAQRTPKVLPPLDGDTFSVAFAINIRGETAGVSGIDVYYETTAVAWDRKGTPRALAPLPGDPHSEALGINKRGEVAGNSGVFSYETRDSTAVRWDRKGVAMALPPLPGGDSSRAYGINAAGEVVGNSGGTAVIWDRAGFPRILAPLPGDSASRGKAINNRGMAAGLSFGPGGTRAVIWSRDGTPRALLPLEDQYDVEVGGINWRGEVVGTIHIVDQAEAAVIWDRNGEPRVLERIVYEDQPGEPDFFIPSDAHGIEPTREVVGFSGFGVAMLWDRSGTLIDLPPLESGGFGDAYAINKRGEIAGISTLYDGVPGFETEIAVVWR